MMISLYYIKHHPSRKFLSRLRESIPVYWYILYPLILPIDFINPATRRFQPSFNIAPNTQSAFNYFTLTRIFPHGIIPLSFHFRKTLKSAFPTPEKTRIFFHLSPLLTFFTMLHFGLPSMPTGLGGLLPWCTLFPHSKSQ